MITHLGSSLTLRDVVSCAQDFETVKGLQPAIHIIWNTVSPIDKD